MVKSHLGNEGPAFAPGMTPSVLGWGPDDVAYPEQFVVNPPDGAEMCWVPAGEFDMGSPAEEQAYALEWAKREYGDDATASLFADESPLHPVRITQGFWLYRHEVTNGQYRKLKPAHDSDEFLDKPLNGGNQPVVDVSWEDAEAYCGWAEARLPTEAEWEYACRAGTKTRFWWGESETDAGQYANVADKALGAYMLTDFLDTDDGCAVSAPVGSYVPNAFGLCYMLGNAWEWCADWYFADYYGESPEVDPAGPAEGTYRLLRGGSWGGSPPVSCRSARRILIIPGGGFLTFGFRVARTP
jgi:formylglycine-generating enzyme required for sulfatase activity